MGIDNVNGVATLKGLEGIFGNLVSASLGFAGILLFIFIVIGGFKYLTSSGDPKKTQSAQQTLTWALIGMVVLVSAYFILQLIATFTGQDEITNFVITR